MESKPENEICKFVKVSYSEPGTDRVRVVHGLRRPDCGDFLVISRSDNVRFEINRRFVIVVVEEPEPFVAEVL